MQERSDDKKKKPEEPKKPKPELQSSMSDPGHTPGTAEGDRRKIEESLGERPSTP